MKPGVATVLKEYAVITLGCLIFALAWEGFMIPNGMSSGGLMGLCTVVQYATDGLIQTSYSYIIVNIVLILLSVIALGLGFGFKTIYSIFITTVFLNLVQGAEFLHSVPGEFFYVRETVLIPIIAGVLEAAGIGLMIRNGGSSGGTDIIAIMVNKYWPVKLSKVFLITDFVIISALLFLPDRSFCDMVYGYEMMVTFSVTIDFIISGKKSSSQLLVFSEKYKDIADYIIKEMDRGVTILNAQGWYTKKEKNVILLLISQQQLPEITKVIKEIDPKAFMSISQTSNVYGEGFEEIKTGLSKKKKEQ